MKTFLDHWSSPDSAMAYILGLIFGASSVVVTAFAIVNGLLGWRDATRSVLRGFRSARRQVPARSVRPTSAGGVAALHGLVFLLQAVWLFATYVTGVLISSAAGVGPAITGANLGSRSGIAAILGDDTPVSAGVLAGAVLALMFAYKRAGDRYGDMDSLIFIFGGLPWLFAIFGVIGAALDAVVWALGGGHGAHADPLANLSGVLIPLTGAAVTYAYYKACCVAFNSPAFLHRLRQQLTMTGDTTSSAGNTGGLLIQGSLAQGSTNPCARKSDARHR